MRREGHVQVFPDGIGQESFSFPEKIVMMGNGGNSDFGYEFGNGQSQRQVHGNGQHIFRDNDVNVELFDKMIQLVLEFFFNPLNKLRYISSSDPNAETVFKYVDDGGVVEMGLFGKIGTFRRCIQFAREIITVKPLFSENIGPFPGFQGNPIRAGQPG